jgi:hypothetical protein
MPVAAGAQLLRVEPGLHTLVVAPARGAPNGIPGMRLPAVFVGAPETGEAEAVQLISTLGAGCWIGAAGGSVVMRAPAGGGYVLVTAYMVPGQATSPLDVELRPIGDAEFATAAATPSAAGAAATRRAEIVLHIEREGDRRFAAGGWAGRIGSRLRVEALAVRPLEAISLGDVEYKAYARGGRETPWVSNGQLCGTRGQGQPLIGFAIRLAPHLRDRFDVVYRGAFFSSGPALAVSNGEACFASLLDDPLEAVEVRIVERSGAGVTG